MIAKKQICVPILLLALCTSVFSQANEQTPQEYAAWRQRHSAQEGDPVWLTPRQMVCPDRYDLLAKYIYAYLKELGAQTSWGRELYEAHLRVWNNYYEAFPHKWGIQAFYDSFHETLASIKKQGFDDTQSRVPVRAGTRMILNGSHRMGAALLYYPDIPIQCPTIVSMRGAPFKPTADYFKNKETFVKGGLPTKYLDAMTLEYVQLKPNTFIICLFPGARTKDAHVEQIIKEYAEIVYSKEVELKNHGPKNFILTLYHKDSWTHNPQFVDFKVNWVFKNAHATKPMRVYVIETDKPQELVNCKSRIRSLFNLAKHSAHINDTHDETLCIARAVLNENSIHFLNHADCHTLERFYYYFAQYSKWIANADVDERCFCIDSSAVLAAYGLRDCKDLDFLHYGYDDQLPRIANIDSHNSWAHHYPVHKDDIIFHPDYHFYYLGIKFASLDVVQSMKVRRNEPKDQRDVALVRSMGR